MTMINPLTLATTTIVLNAAAARIRERDSSPQAREVITHALEYIRRAWYGELGLAYRKKLTQKLEKRLERYFSAEWIMTRASFHRGEDDPRRYKRPPEQMYPHIGLFRSGGVLSLLHFLNRLLMNADSITVAEREKAAAAIDTLADACDHALSATAYQPFDDD